MVLSPASWGVVLDCGSSGTRLHIFTWETPSGAVTEYSPPNASAFSIVPGISSFSNDPAALGPYIMPLLRLAVEHVPTAAHNSTRLLAMATAGMRLLSPAQEEPIWAALRHEFGSTPFRFSPGDAMTISGNFEGLYGWLSAGYLANIAPGDKPLGWLDYGGASTQISFLPQGDSPTLLQDAYRVRRQRGVESTTTRLYAHSYMRSGQTEAQRRMASLLPGAGSASKLSSPCYNHGLLVKWEGLCGPSGECHNGTTLVNGTGDWQGCAKLTDKLLHRDYECLLPPCAALGVYQPTPAGVRFIAGSAFFYTAYGLGLVGWDESKNLTRAQFDQAGSAFCAKPWAAVKADPFAAAYCFSSAYVGSMLGAFGLDASPTVEFARKLGGATVSWALGAQLYALREQGIDMDDAGEMRR
jgi:hypothetical protein